MGKTALILNQFIITLFLSFALYNIECSDVKFDDIRPEGKHLYLMNDVDMSPKYEFGTVKAQVICDNKNKCNNGGKCFNSTCICLPGTSGPLCETINACGDLSCKKDKHATCDFDKTNFKAYCKCPFGQEFDYDENKCKDCLCEDDSYCLEDHVCSRQLKCEFIEGERSCLCNMPSFKLNPKTQVCQWCNCGPHADDCYFDKDGNQKCKCKDDYAERFHGCEKCTCSHSDACEFEGFNKICKCQAGYVLYKNDCYKCTCGNHGKCEFQGIWSISQIGCNCDPGFIEKDGVCTDVSECYCGENSNCTLINGEKNCSCPEGFTNMNGLCTDINECDDPESCPENRICYNLIGSYECLCADGFQDSKDKEGECEDIDECQSRKTCTDENSECLNTIGSFRCVCKWGFVTRDGIASNLICEDKSSWKTGFGFLIGVFLAVAIVLAILIYKKTT